MSYSSAKSYLDGNLKLRVNWNESTTNTAVSLMPAWERYDTSTTDNDGSYFYTILNPDPSGDGRWGDLSWGTGSGWREVDYTAAQRSYTRTHSAQTVTAAFEIHGGFGSWYSGSFHVYTWDTFTVNFTYTIPAKPSYTVKFDANGGSGAPSSQTKWYGESLTLSTTKPSRTGYTFLGWSTSSSATTATYQAGGSYTSNSAATLYAVWQINTWTVSYDANGGSGAPSAQTKTYGQALTISSTTPTRTGYAFKRWVSSRSDGTFYFYPGDTTTYNGNQTLVAEWTLNTYTISYNGNNATSGSVSSQTKNYGESLTLRSNGYSKTGHTFSKWNTKADGSGTNYNAGASYTANASATMYAQWTPNTYTVSYNANGGSSAPSSQTKTYGVDLTLRSGTPTRSGYTFQGWATSANGSVAYQPSGTYKSNSAVTLYAVWKVNAPTVAPTIGTNTRNSDTQNTVTWTYSTTTPPVTTFYIERSTNGGSYSQIAAVDGTGSGSYIDKTTSSNAYYRYRVRCGNSTGKSGYSSASNYTYNTPAKPTDLTAVFNSSLQVELKWTQPGITQNEVIVENSTDNSTWSTVATLSGTASSYTDTNPPSGTVYYRVKNRSNRTPVLTSSASNAVQVLTLAKPNAPTLKSPANGKVYNMPSSVTLSWTHNSTDGTSQSAAIVQYSTDNGSTWTGVSVTTAQSYSLNTSSYPANTVITWMVSTKGTYESYSDYSATRNFYIRQAPSVDITYPASTDGGTITDVPVKAGFSYSDDSGSFTSASIAVRNSDGVVLYERTPTWTVSGSDYSFDIPVADFLPSNDESFTLTITANSTSGLSTTATRVFATDYVEPNPPILTYEVNTENCSVSLMVEEGTGSSQIATVAVGVFRVSKDGEKAIAAVMNSGDSVTDYLPPLDQEFTYRAVAYTTNGLTSQTLETVRVDSDGRCMFNWGDGFSECAGFNMDLTWKTSIDHERSLYKVVGLADPVVRTTNRRTKSLSASGSVWWDDNSKLEELQNIPGTVYFREPRGHVIPVVVRVDLSYPKGNPITSASISMTQIAEVADD